MIDRLLRQMTALPFESVRAAWIARAKSEAGRTAEAREWLRAYGYVELPDGAAVINSGEFEYTSDGRQVLRAQGKTWAIDAAEWERRKNEARGAQQRWEAGNAQNHGQSSGAPATCPALIDGQLCGGTLVPAPVCPRCALGKSGVAATLTCDVCGHITAIMRGDK